MPPAGPLVLLVPNQPEVVPLNGVTPATPSARAELLATRRVAMRQAFTQVMPLALWKADAERVVELPAVGSFLVPESLAVEYESVGFGRVVRAQFHGYASSGMTPSASHPWQLGAIGLTEAKRTGNGDGVVVGIADSWIHDTHKETPLPADLAAFDDQGAQLSKLVPRASGHGSAVASLIAGPGFGVSPKATIAFVSVLRQPSGHHFVGTAAQVAAGLQYLDALILPGAGGGRMVRIINASFHVNAAGKDGAALRKIVDTLTATGILLVAGTGNTFNANVAYPASETSVLGVGALLESGTSWGGTARDDRKPDVWAPGKTVYATSSGYQLMPWVGTSMASAITAGAAAAILSRDSSLDPSRLRARVMTWARRVGSDKHLDLTQMP